MKKKAFAIFILAICLVLSCALVACDPKVVIPDPEVYEVSYDNLQADSYRDYASEVKLNVDKYPELERQGLRLVTGYSNNYYAVADEGRPDDVEVIRQSFDETKGILVIINGLQLNIGRNKNANMQSDSRLDELELFGKENDITYFTSDEKNEQTYDLAKYWRDNGYNVFYFHWEMFADYYRGSLLDMAEAPPAIQERIWTQDTGVQATYVRGGKTYMTELGEAVNGSVAELFAAEYLRMATAVAEVYPGYASSNKDVRIAGHSMGGLLAVASSTLLNLLAGAGQLPIGMAPNRVALMDSYLGVSSHPEYKISWSNKDYIHPDGDESCCNYIAALDMLVNKFGVAAEFVCNEGFVVPFFTALNYNEDYGYFQNTCAKYANKILEFCPIVLVRPYFCAVSGEIMFNGHNAVREWYLSSLLYDAPVTKPAAGSMTVPTAKMSDADVRAARGNYFVMCNDMKRACETVRCDDDYFVLNKTEQV